MVPFPDWYLLKLLAHFRSGRQAVKLAHVTELWGCSAMTAKRQLARLQDAGCLTYQPGMGRGNPSALTLYADTRQTIDQTVQELVRRRQLGELARLSRLPFPVTWTFTPEVQALFGVTHSREGRDRLRTIMFRPLATLHPVYTSNALEAHLLKQVYDPLVEYDPASRALTPSLAHHWDTQDGQDWTFHLRKEVEFHDGREFTSLDVQATLDALKVEAPWFLNHLQQVDTDGPYRVHLHLNGPDFYLPHRLSDNTALIRPAHALSTERPIGSGPFRLTRLPEGLHLTAFNHHFGYRPLIDEVEIYHVAHADQSVTWAVPGEEGVGQSTLNFIEGVNYLCWNAASDAAHDLNLRLAVKELLDMSTFFKETGQEETWLPAHAFAFRRSEGRSASEHSLAKARAYLQRADRLTRPLQLACVDRWDAVPLAQWLARRLTAENVPCEVRVFQLGENDWRQTADLHMLAEVSGADDQHAFWQIMHDPALGFTHWLPTALLSEVRTLLGGFRLAQSFEEREALIEQAEAALCQEGWVNLTHHRQVRRPHHPLMRGVTTGAFGRIDFRRFWLG